MSEFSEAQKSYMDALFNKISSTFNEKTLELKEDLKSQIDEIKQDFNKIANSYKEEITKLELHNYQLQKNVIQLERKVRKNNLVIYGINNLERNICDAILKIFREKLEVDITENDINDLYKLGKHNTSPVLIEFISFRKKQLVLENAKKLKGTNISISKDLCASDRVDNKKLVTHMKEAKKRGITSYIKGNKLVIGEDIYTADQIGNTDNCFQGEDIQNFEKNPQKADSTPSTPNPLRREKHLLKEVGQDEKLDKQHREYQKPKAAEKTIKNKTSTVKTRSNSTTNN